MRSETAIGIRKPSSSLPPFKTQKMFLRLKLRHSAYGLNNNYTQNTLKGYFLEEDINEISFSP